MWTRFIIRRMLVLIYIKLTTDQLIVLQPPRPSHPGGPLPPHQPLALVSLFRISWQSSIKIIFILHPWSLPLFRGWSPHCETELCLPSFPTCLPTGRQPTSQKEKMKFLVLWMELTCPLLLPLETSRTAPCWVKDHCSHVDHNLKIITDSWEFKAGEDCGWRLDPFGLDPLTNGRLDNFVLLWKRNSTTCTTILRNQGSENSVIPPVHIVT